MEFNVIAESAPPCALCRTHNAPYIRTHVTQLPIKTAEGEKVYEGEIVVCVGTADRPGCVRGMANAIGAQAPELVAQAAEQHRVALERQAKRGELAAAIVAELQEVVTRRAGDLSDTEG